MLGLPSTTDLALLGVVCAAIAGGMLYERHEGAASVKRVDKTAEVAQAAKDLADAKGTIDELKAKLAAVPPAQPPPVLRLCVSPRSLRAQPTSPGTQPDVASAARASPGGVSEGTPGIDIGPAVSDLKRAAEVSAIYRDELWGWSLKQATK